MRNNSINNPTAMPINEGPIQLEAQEQEAPPTAQLVDQEAGFGNYRKKMLGAFLILSCATVLVITLLQSGINYPIFVGSGVVIFTIASCFIFGASYRNSEARTLETVIDGQNQREQSAEVEMEQIMSEQRGILMPTLVFGHSPAPSAPTLENLNSATTSNQNAENQSTNNSEQNSSNPSSTLNSPSANQFNNGRNQSSPRNV